MSFVFDPVPQNVATPLSSSSSSFTSKLHAQAERRKELYKVCDGLEQSSKRRTTQLHREHTRNIRKVAVEKRRATSTTITTTSSKQEIESWVKLYEKGDLKTRIDIHEKLLVASEDDASLPLINEWLQPSVLYSQLWKLLGGIVLAPPSKPVDPSETKALQTGFQVLNRLMLNETLTTSTSMFSTLTSNGLAQVIGKCWQRAECRHVFQKPMPGHHIDLVLELLSTTRLMVSRNLLVGKDRFGSVWMSAVGPMMLQCMVQLNSVLFQKNNNNVDNALDELKELYYECVMLLETWMYEMNDTESLPDAYWSLILKACFSPFASFGSTNKEEDNHRDMRIRIDATRVLQDLCMMIPKDCQNARFQTVFQLGIPDVAAFIVEHTTNNDLQEAAMRLLYQVSTLQSIEWVKSIFGWSKLSETIPTPSPGTKPVPLLLRDPQSHTPIFRTILEMLCACQSELAGNNENGQTDVYLHTLSLIRMVLMTWKASLGKSVAWAQACGEFSLIVMDAMTLVALKTQNSRLKSQAYFVLFDILTLNVKLRTTRFNQQLPQLLYRGVDDLDVDTVMVTMDIILLILRHLREIKSLSHHAFLELLEEKRVLEKVDDLRNHDNDQVATLAEETYKWLNDEDEDEDDDSDDSDDDDSTSVE